MSKSKKVIVTIVACLLMTAVGIYLLLPKLLSSELVKQRIVNVAKTSLGAELTFDLFDVDMKSGHISLGNVRFERKAPGDVLEITFDKAEMDIRLLPLLAKRVHIEKLEIQAPRIYLVRHERFQVAGQNSEDDKKVVHGNNVVIDKITIENGQLEYMHTCGDGEQMEVSLEGLNYSTTGITLRRLPRLISAATLSVRDVQLKRTDPTSSLELTTEKVSIRNNAKKSRAGLYQVDTVELFGPEVRYVVERPKEIPVHGTKDKVLNFINKKLKDSKEPRQGGSIERYEYSISELLVHEGRLEYVARREGVETFTAQLSGLEYNARDIAYHTFGNFVVGADIEADILMGSPAHLSKKSSEGSGTFHLTNVDLDYADRYFSQTDALVIDSGSMDIRYEIHDGPKGRYEVNLAGFQLAENADSSAKEFMFVPVSKIVDHVNGTDGELELWFELDSQFDVSDDLETIVMRFWEGMWKALFKKITAKGIEDALETGAEKLPLNEKATKLKNFLEEKMSEHRKQQ